MNEKQFLDETPIGSQKILIAKKVYNLDVECYVDGKIYYTVDNPDGVSLTRYKFIDPYTWQGMGKGIEHANENGYTLAFSQWYDGSWDVGLVREGEDTLVEGCKKTIFLAFWIAYLKALGVLE